MSKKIGALSPSYPRVIKITGCALLALAMCSVTARTLYAQGDNFCPRNAYLSVHAFKDMSNKNTVFAKDPNFKIGTFLSMFGSLFTTPRLSLKPTQRPEYSLTVSFYQIKFSPFYAEKSMMSIILGFIGGEVFESDPSLHYLGGDPDWDQYFSGVRLLTIITESTDLDPRSHIPLVQAELAKQKSIDDIIVAYEEIPISAFTNEEPWCGYDDNNPNPYQIDFLNFKTALPPPPDVPNTHTIRIIARAERGDIENGDDFCKEDRSAKVFRLPNFYDTFFVNYRPPDGPDKSDTVTLYNSCEVNYERYVPLNETKKHTKIAEMKVNCKERWSVELTFNKTVGGKEDFGSGMTRELGWTYSATVKAVVEFVRSSGSDRIYESKSSNLDFTDNFWQHIVLKTEDHTCEGRLSWTGTHNGTIQVPVRMMIHGRAGRCSFGFGSRKGAEPIVFKMGINLWGDEKCGGPKAWQGQSEVKDVMFDASGTDFPDHIPKPIAFKPGQKEVSGQDQWTSKAWLRFYEVKVPIDPSKFPVESRPLLALLRVTPMMSEKIPASATLTWKATKLGQKN